MTGPVRILWEPLGPARMHIIVTTPPPDNNRLYCGSFPRTWPLGEVDPAARAWAILHPADQCTHHTEENR